MNAADDLLAMLCYWIGLSLAAIALLGCVLLLAMAWRRTPRQPRRLWVVSIVIFAVTLIASPLLLWTRAESVMETFGARAMTSLIVSGSGHAFGLILAGGSLAILLLSLALFHRGSAE
jgi:membrane associated rhomboid family serine protease